MVNIIFGKKEEDEFISVSGRLEYISIAERIDNINTRKMWQEYNVSKTSKRIIVRYFCFLVHD